MGRKVKIKIKYLVAKVAICTLTNKTGLYNE